MATTTINGNAADGRVSKAHYSATWAQIRDANTGIASGTSDASSLGLTQIQKWAGGYIVIRSFFWFDTTAINASGDTVTAVTLKIRGLTYGTSDVIVVKSNAFGGDGSAALSAGSFDGMPGWTDGASQAGNVTDYSSEVSTWSTSGYNDITLNATARTDVQNNDAFIICLMDYDYDYTNNAIPSGYALSGGYFADDSSYPPQLVVEHASAGYGHTVLTVAAANISTVKGVATANISEVIGT